MKRLINTVLAGLFTITGLAAAPALAEGAKQKVVYHINYDDPKQEASALRNVQNHINAVGAENLDLKVVLHGDGLQFAGAHTDEGEALLHCGLRRHRDLRAPRPADQAVGRRPVAGRGGDPTPGLGDAVELAHRRTAAPGDDVLPERARQRRAAC